MSIAQGVLLHEFAARLDQFAHEAKLRSGRGAQGGP
jgi:hypothetical protein